MSQNGPQRPLLIQYGYTLSQSTCFGAIHAFMGQKNRLQTGQNWPKTNSQYRGPLNARALRGTTFQLLPTYIYIGEGMFAKNIPWYPFSARHSFSLLLILLARASDFRRKLWLKIVSFNSRFDGQLFGHQYNVRSTGVESANFLISYPPFQWTVLTIIWPSPDPDKPLP